jgi:predicted nucleic acid-binding protein
MNVEYLLDASALYGLVAHYRRWVRHKERLAILHLTVYEVGNALWKEARAGGYRGGRPPEPSRGCCLV